MKDYYFYIMTNTFGNVMYVGVTNNLERRVLEHKSGLVSGFSQKYKINKLVYYEQTASVTDAIAREKEVKKWRREKKNRLVENLNPQWKDLSTEEGDFSVANAPSK